jgi:hypothetical protein
LSVCWNFLNRVLVGKKVAKTHFSKLFFSFSSGWIFSRIAVYSKLALTQPASGAAALKYRVFKPSFNF